MPSLFRSDNLVEASIQQRATAAGGVEVDQICSFQPNRSTLH